MLKMADEKKPYDWKITANKFFVILVQILIAGGLAYATDHPEFMALVPIIEAFRNWWKHR